MDTLIANATLVTMNERMDVLFGAFLGITQGKITLISKTAPETPPKTVIDGTGMVVLPGLINCHTHLATTGLRSLLDDNSQQEALEEQLKKESKLDTRGAKAAALLGIAECLRFGVTSVSDLYLYPEATAQAVAESGIKANLALSATRFLDESEDFDFETDPQCRELCRLVEQWQDHDEGRIRIDAGFHAPYTSNYKLWEGLVAYAREAGLSVQFHLSEGQQETEDSLDRTGLTPAELVNCHGLLDLPATVAGCAGLTEEDRALLGKKKVTAVSTPLANSKAGMPAMGISATVKAGVNVALGTGGAVECGNLDMFEVLRAAAGAERTLSGNSAAMPAPAVLMMATICGARAQGRAAQCGMLKEGMDADLALLDFSAPHLIPCHNVLSSLVFSAKGGDVAMTMVRGKILYQNGQFPTIDLKNVVEELTTHTIGQMFAEKE